MFQKLCKRQYDYKFSYPKQRVFRKYKSCVTRKPIVYKKCLEHLFKNSKRVCLFLLENVTGKLLANKLLNFGCFAYIKQHRNSPASQSMDPAGHWNLWSPQSFSSNPESHSNTPLQIVQMEIESSRIDESRPIQVSDFQTKKAVG